MFDLYATQKISIKPRVGTKDNGAPVFGSPQIINGRIQYRHRLLRTTNAEEIVSKALIMSTVPIHEGDVVVLEGRDWPVLISEPIYGLSAVPIHWEANL